MVLTKKLARLLNYGGVDFNLILFKKGKTLDEFGSAPEGKELLAIEVTAQNSSEKQAFIFPNEEIKLMMCEEKITPSNYTFGTSLDPGQSSRGYLLFLIPAKAKEAKLVFGKTEEKEVINFYIS